MLFYSNGRGMPHNLNIYHSQGEKYPWTLETVSSTKAFETMEGLLDYLKSEGLLNDSIRNALFRSRETGAADSLTWTQLGTSEDTLSRVLEDAGIYYAEPVDYPLTDGLTLYISDRNGKPRILEITIADGFLDDPNGFNGIPLEVRLSSPIGE